MAAPGTYLSSFVENFLRSRGLEEQRSRSEAQEAGEIFKLNRYLDELGRERGAEATLAEMLRGRPSYPPNRPVIPSDLPTGQISPEVYQGPPNPEAPPLPPVAPQAPSVAAGGLAALRQPRAAVSEAVFQGVTPEQQARFMGTQTGRAALPSLEAAERERRKEEDRVEAEDLFGKATQAITEKNPAGWADMMAAAYRRLGAHDRAGQMMEYAARVRTEKDEQEQAPKDFETIHNAVVAWQEDPAPANLAKIHEAMAAAKSVTAKALGLEMTKNAVSKALSADRDVDAFFRHATLRSVRDGVPVQDAWKEAMDRYPRGFAKLWQQDIMQPDKTRLPEFVWSILKMDPPGPKKDQTLSQRAWIIAKSEAQKRGITDPTQFTRLWQEQINELTKQEATAKREPEDIEKKKVELETARDRAAITKMRREAMEKPESLEGKSSQELTLLIQRTSRDLQSGDLSSEEERDAKAYLGLLRKALTAKGGKVEPSKPEMPPAKKYKNQTIRHPETGERFRSDGTNWTPVP